MQPVAVAEDLKLCSDKAGWASESVGKGHVCWKHWVQLFWALAKPGDSGWKIGLIQRNKPMASSHKEILRKEKQKLNL